jgi:hypothetical protein
MRFIKTDGYGFVATSRVVQIVTGEKHRECGHRLGSRAPFVVVFTGEKGELLHAPTDVLIEWTAEQVSWLTEHGRQITKVVTRLEREVLKAVKRRRKK